MKKMNVTTLILSALLSILAYSFVAMAYVHDTFPTRNEYDLILDRLKTIEEKIDNLK